jgi:hypothetical protein
VYRVLAEVVLIVHFAFVAFVAVGALLAWRWPSVVWLHVPTLVWSVAIITIGFTCPLTPLEKSLRRRAGVESFEGGWIDHYLEDVVYPERSTNVLRALVAVVIVVGYVGAFVRWRRRTTRPSDQDAESAGFAAR